MPDITWNKGWKHNLKSFQRGDIRGRWYGDQWGDPSSAPALRKIVQRFIHPFVNQELVALEIGSGGGRWTQFLLPFRKVYCVELNPEMFDYLRSRFPAATNLHFIRTNGTDLPGVPPAEVGYVFSFGTLVHLDVPIIASYVENLRPVVRAGGTVCLQFSDKRKPLAQKNPDFSDNRPEVMQALLERQGFRVEEVDEDTLPHSAVIRATAT